MTVSWRQLRLWRGKMMGKECPVRVPVRCFRDRNAERFARGSGGGVGLVELLLLVSLIHEVMTRTQCTVQRQDRVVDAIDFQPHCRQNELPPPGSRIAVLWLVEPGRIAHKLSRAAKVRLPSTRGLGFARGEMRMQTPLIRSMCGCNLFDAPRLAVFHLPRPNKRNPLDPDAARRTIASPWPHHLSIVPHVYFGISRFASITTLF